METVTTMIAQLGFPIAVAAYLLIRMEGTIKELTKVVQALTISTSRSDPAMKRGIDNGSQ